MKNIIFLTYLNLWSIDENKGAPSFHKTIEAYLKDGWNVTLINPKYSFGVTPKMEGLYNVTFHPFFYPMVKIKKIGFIGRILHSIQGNHYFYKLGKEVLRRYDNYACIYAYEVNGVNAGKKLAQEYNLPFITRFQGTVLASIKDNWLNRLKKYPHFHALETEADITIMTDDGTKGDMVLSNLYNKSKVIKFWKNGVDIGSSEEDANEEIEKLRKKFSLLSNDRILITISRLVYWKRVDRAIEALSEVIKENKNVKLVIVGDGNEKQNLIDLTKKLTLESNVIFVGAVEQSDVRDYLEMADVFLSLYDLSNVGNPLLEAMSCGKPIITLNVGNTESLITNNENGVLLDLNQLNDIPKYIHKIINDRKFAEKIGKNAKKYAKENFWSWDERMKAETDIVSQLYENWEFNSQ